LTAIRSTAVALPLERRIVSSVRRTDTVINLIVELETNDGATGVSYIAGFSPHKLAATAALIDELGEVLIGSDATAIGSAWDRIRSALTLAGHAGISAFALSAIDIAMWDLQGKLLGAPVHRLLGSRRETLTAYASDGCWLEEDPKTVAREAAQFAASGFRTVKVRLGRSERERDFAVLDAVRQEVGDDLELILDVNQGWSREEARAYGRRLEPYRVRWLEEPLLASDIDGLVMLRRELAVPLAAGENLYLPDGIRALVTAQAVSVINPDLQRIGGITGWIRASAIAEAWSVPVAAHLFPEISVHVMAAAELIGPLEWVSWMTPLLEQPLRIEKGTVKVPTGPGLGMTFNKDAVRAHRLD